MSRTKDITPVASVSSIKALEDSGYVHSPKCAICKAIHPVTHVPARPDVEELWVRAGSQRTLSFLRGIGINISIRQLQRHVADHAPYLRSGIWLKRTQEMIKQAADEHADAETAVQNIINIGNRMVMDGALPVTERLYVESLKIQNKTKQVSSLHDFINQVEQGAFGNAELVDDNKPVIESPRPTVIDAPVSPEIAPENVSEPKEVVSVVEPPKIVPEVKQEPKIIKKKVAKKPKKVAIKKQTVNFDDEFKPFFPESEEE